MAELKDLVGKHIFSGIEVGGDCAGSVKFTLDGVTYKAEEDECDGYRSYMRDLLVVEELCKIQLPDVEVICRMRDSCWDDVLEFIDTLNGQTILTLGTVEYLDYYPYCVMEYTPENMSCNADRT